MKGRDTHGKMSGMHYKIARFPLLVITLACTSLLFANDTPIAGQMTGIRGCTVKYEHYLPDIARTSTTIVLAHGFKRKLTNMRGWASQWSKQGIPVVIPSLCNSSWIQGRHEENASDLVSLREQLSIDKVIYAGFSAGGLAAYLAAKQDAATLAYLGLDPVDSGKLAINSDGRLTVPALYVLSKSSRCNGHNNFLSVIEGQKAAQVVKFDNATHCHFELPYDRKCAWACGRSDEQTTGDRQQEISFFVMRCLLDLLSLNDSKQPK
jgi:hypothetical protein